MLPEPEPINAADAELLEIVHEHGFQVTHISAEGDAPGWAYSIGMFRTYGQPEVVVFGLKQPVAHAVVNELGRRARTDGLEDGQVHDGLLEGYGCTLRTVEPNWYPSFFGWALWYYQHEPFPVLQAIWPDRSHRYPWDPLFFEPWRDAQPLLYESEPVAANALKLLQSMREQ